MYHEKNGYNVNFCNNSGWNITPQTTKPINRDINIVALIPYVSTIVALIIGMYEYCNPDTSKTITYAMHTVNCVVALYSVFYDYSGPLSYSIQSTNENDHILAHELITNPTFAVYNINTPNDSQLTYLMLALMHNKPATARALIREGIDITKTDSFGRDALDYARNFHHNELIPLLNKLNDFRKPTTAKNRLYLITTSRITMILL